MKPLQSAEINRRNGLADGCQEWNYIDTSNGLCADLHARSIKSSLLLPTILSSDEKIFPSIKTNRDASGYFFDYLNWTISTKNPNRFVSFFSTPPLSLSFSLSPSMRFETKFAQAFRRFAKDKEKKIFSSIGGSWKCIEISVPVRIGLNVTRHFPWASWNTRGRGWRGEAGNRE